MAKITMEQVKQLRRKTQVGMMDCKKALMESDGDFEKAIEILRKKGAAVAAKRAGSETNNGNIASCISDNLKSGALVKIGCETDFSANTQAMKNFAQEVCKNVLVNNPTCIKDGENCLINQKVVSKPAITIQDHLNEIIAKIGEKIEIAQIARFQVEKEGIVSSYIHPGANLGILVEFETDKAIDSAHKKEIKQLGKNICMQIAVTNPLAISPDQLDATALEKERTFIKEQLAASGKPENILEMNKYYEDVCLLNQKFIKNDKISIKEQINQVVKKVGLQIEVKQFARFAIGK